MSSEAVKKAYAVRGLKPGQKQLLIHLCWKHRRGFPLIQTYRQLAEAVWSSTRTICRQLEQLERLGYIRRSPARLPGKQHLVQIELTFLEPDEAAGSRQNPTSKRRRILRQNGAPLIGVNNPAYSPTPSIEVDARKEPHVYRDCQGQLGVLDWEARAAVNPVGLFRESIVKKARQHQ